MPPTTPPPGIQENDPVKMADLISMEDARAVHAETETIARSLYPDIDLTAVHQVFEDILRLFDGEFPGYQGCNTLFHDLYHTTDCYLAMTRLMHGAVLSEVPLTEREFALGMITALMHDTGYIQEQGDSARSGGSYTLIHVDRSISFMERYFREKDWDFEDFELCRRCIKCTGLDVNIQKLRFQNQREDLLGKMLGTADLLGQMAARTYLEKLLHLYREFQEAGVPGFVDELDLLRKTGSFYENTLTRLREELDGAARFVRVHFRERWGLDRDLYQEAIEHNMAYLNEVLQLDDGKYREHLRRGHINEAESGHA